MSDNLKVKVGCLSVVFTTKVDAPSHNLEAVIFARANSIGIRYGSYANKSAAVIMNDIINFVRSSSLPKSLPLELQLAKINLSHF